MPNRIIKESICTSDNLDTLSVAAERFFYRLIVNCDDFGRFDARPQILRGKVFPLKTDSIMLSDISNWLNELVEANLVLLYSNNGRPYIQMITWNNHQQQRAKNSKYPGPDDIDSQLIATDIICDQLQANVSVIRERNTRSEKRDTRTKHVSAAANDGKVNRAEFVSMTNEEYSSLIAEVGEDGAKRCIEILDDYKGAAGKKYKSDYRAIRSWVITRFQEESARSRTTPAGAEQGIKPAKVSGTQRFLERHRGGVPL